MASDIDGAFQTWRREDWGLLMLALAPVFCAACHSRKKK
jgi:hypothetical protein